jgi:hypothetical protein
LLFPAGLNPLSDAAFSTIAYKDSQCFRGFQEKQEKNEKKNALYNPRQSSKTTRVNPQKVKIIHIFFFLSGDAGFRRF